MKTLLLSKLYGFYQFFKLSFFNIWRNRRRTVITVTSICIGTITFVLLNGYIEIISQGLKNDAVMKQYGHMQIGMKGYFDADSNSYHHLIDMKKAEIIKNEIYQLDSVDYINMRLHLAGIIGNNKESTVFLSIAGFPDTENLMAPTLVEGNLLSDDDPYGILMGRSMATKLGVKSGDSLLVFVTSESGSQEAIQVNVRGIYEALMKEQEKVIIFMSLKAGSDLLLETKIHHILIFFRTDLTDKAIHETKQKINSIIKEKYPDFEVKEWEELAVFYKQIIGLFNGVSLVIGTILFIVISFNIQNTMQMSIIERYREIGTMRAMGSSRLEIILDFIGEGILIGIIGSIIGVVIALSLGELLNHLKLFLPPGPGQDKPTPLVFYITWIIVFKAIFINLVISLIASYFPARRGGKLKIITALKFV